ncbi:MAG: hypothetical protein WCF18_12860 [Chthoniobacteraceae bacterium]
MKRMSRAGCLSRVACVERLSSPRKEFFRVPLEHVRTLAAEKGLEVTFTMAAAAREYRETVALEK